MFCLTAIRACRPWPSVVAAVTRRQGLNTRSSPALAAAQAQSGIKKRTQRRKPAAVEDTGQRQGFWCVSAFSTAEEFRLEQLSAALSETNMYEPTCLYSGSDDSAETAPADVIHAVSKFHVTNEPRHLYFFREGSVVGWNVSDLEVGSLMNFLAEHEIGSYDDHIVMGEREVMYYAYTNEKKSSIQKGNFHLISEDVTASDLDRYTFSNAMAHSVKLGTWEALLEEYIDSVEVVTQWKNLTIMWSVINFVEDNTVEVVPSFWVHKTNCAWPKKNATHFIKRRIPPNKFDFDYLQAKKLCSDLDDYTIAKQKAKASEDTSNISSSNETSQERLTRFQKTKKKVMKNEFKKIEKLKWNTNSLDSPASSIDEEDDDSDKDPNYSNTVIHEENIILETPPSKQKSILKDLPKTFPGTSLFKRKLNFDTNKCKSLSPKSKMCNVINFNEVEKIITTSSSPFKVTDNNLSSNSTPHSNNDILTKINRTTLNTWYEIKALVERIESLENSLLNKGSKEVLNDDSDNNFIFALPLSNEDELEIFEEKLLDTVFKKKLISELSRLVRGTLPSTVRAIMRYMFKDILLEQYSFKGQKKKKVFHTLKSCSVIFDSIKKINKFQNFNSIDVEQPIKIFIAGAKFRNKPESSEF